MDKDRQKRRILDNVIKEGASCWSWIPYATTLKTVLAIKGKRWTVPRLAYTLWIGEVPEGKFVLKKCGRRDCVNPNHMFLGDHAHERYKQK